jgi:hypothetical protein
MDHALTRSAHRNISSISQRRCYTTEFPFYQSIVHNFLLTKLGGRRGRAQNEQGVARARNDAVGPSIIVAEFDKRGGFGKRFDNGANAGHGRARLPATPWRRCPPVG